MSHYILDKAYSIDDVAGVEAYRVVVQGAAAGHAKLPTAANAGALLGITVHGQSRQTGHVSVRKAGIARVAAAGPIALGAPVNAAGASGKVKAVNEAPGTLVQCLGFAETASTADGDLVEVFIALHERTAP